MNKKKTSKKEWNKNYSNWPNQLHINFYQKDKLNNLLKKKLL